MGIVTYEILSDCGFWVHRYVFEVVPTGRVYIGSYKYLRCLDV